MADEDKNKQHKVDFIQHELGRIYSQCVKEGRTWISIRKAASPFLEEEFRPRKKTLLIISVLICVFATLLYYRPYSRLMAAIISQATISMLSMWDWRWLHDVSCFWDNPYLEDQGRVLETIHCQLCSEMSHIPKLHIHEASSQLIAEKYLDNDIPVMVEDVNSQATALDDIIKVFLDDKVLNLYSCCGFVSNIEVPGKNHREFLHRLREHKYTSYYAHWTNCFKDAAKLFRKVYTRPEFLPSSIELTEANWVFISSKFTEDISVKLPIDEGVIMLLQLAGSMNVTLTPKDVCESSCKSLTVSLLEGFTLIVPDFLYHVTYQPSQDVNSITVGLGASFDV